MHDVTPRTLASRRFPRALAIAIAAAILLAVVATPARAQQSHPPTGNPIADGALNYVGQWGGQCFTFMEMVVEKYVGITVPWGGYVDSYYNAGAYQVSASEARAGDVIQLSDDARPTGSYPGLHTAIILTNHGSGEFTVVDSNRNWNEMVTVHEYAPWGFWAAGRYSNITVRIWRFPLESEATPTPDPTPTATPEAPTVYGAGDTARVDAGGQNLNLRPVPGTQQSPIDQIPHGSLVVIVSGKTVTASGYTWIEVESPHGTGWVATEFLVLHERAEEEEPPQQQTDPPPNGPGTGAGGVEDPFGGETPPYSLTVPGLASD